MAIETPKDPRRQFEVRYLPWALAAVMFAVYLLTLNTWVNLLNLSRVVMAEGWNWQPQLVSPLVFMVSLPFRLFSAGTLPLALNVFSAACSATTLGLLARCVAILPHDRLEVERQRERSDFSFFTGKWAPFPPVLAAGMLGFQQTFWEHGTNFTGESLELLLFVAILWQLLEYRLDEVPQRIYLAALGFGVGVAEHWSFLAYAPVFVTAVIWIRGMDFFNARFLVRLMGSYLAGVWLILLLPLVALVSGQYPVGFWQAMRPALGMDWYILRILSHGFIWRQLVMISLSTFLPLLVLSIRWSANYGDTSGSSKTLVNYLFYLGNAGFLGLCGWVMFDPPFSPKFLTLASTPGLTLYLLAALCLGYFSGFTLLLFGKSPQRSRRGPHTPIPVLPAALMWLCPFIVGGTLIAGSGGLLLLIYKNAPILRAENDHTLLNYARQTTQNLPPNGAILLGDMDAPYYQPVHGYLVEAMLAREGLWNKYPVVDTSSMKFSTYQRFLHRQYPKQWPEIFKDKKPMVFNELGMLKFLNQLACSNTLCYLNPSFGYYFESFYLEPHGLHYNLKTLPSDTLLPPPLDASLIQENQNFWIGLMKDGGADAAWQISASSKTSTKWPDKLLKRLRVPVQANPNAVLAATLYSVGLDAWGVQLAFSGREDMATNAFNDALQVNPGNFSAKVNLRFHRERSRDGSPAIDLARTLPDQLGKANNWEELLAENGPVDDISFAYENAMLLADRSGLYRQAVAPLNWVKSFAPNLFDVRRRLASAYLLNHLPEKALAILEDPARDPARFGLSQADQTSLATLRSAAYFQDRDFQKGIETLNREISRQPDNERLVSVAIQASLEVGSLTNALSLAARKISESPTEPQWWFAQGLALMKSGQFIPAIQSFDHTLTLATNNESVLFDRALACLDAGRLDEARKGYLQLQADHPNSFQIAYGLGEIAWKLGDTNEAVKNYRLYLANSPTNTPEALQVSQRLKILER